MGRGDLKIRIESRLSQTQQVILYQSDINTDVKFFHTAAWAYPHIAPHARFDIVLPAQITVSAASKIGPGSMSTQDLPAEPGSALEVFDNGGALDVREGDDPSPVDGQISIVNRCDRTRTVLASRNGRPVVAFDVRPEFNVNFSIAPKLSLVMSDGPLLDPFFDFDAAAASKACTVDYQGQQSVTFMLNENSSTGAIEITYSFS